MAERCCSRPFPPLFLMHYFLVECFIIASLWYILAIIQMYNQMLNFPFKYNAITQGQTVTVISLSLLGFVICQTIIWKFSRLIKLLLRPAFPSSTELYFVV